jgi:hypothetical protein
MTRRQWIVWGRQIDACCIQVAAAVDAPTYSCAMKKAADRCAQNRPAIEHLFKELNIGSKTSQGSPVYRIDGGAL